MVKKLLILLLAFFVIMLTKTLEVRSLDIEEENNAVCVLSEEVTVEVVPLVPAKYVILETDYCCNGKLVLSPFLKKDS